MPSSAPLLSSLSLFFPSFNEVPNLRELIASADTVASQVAKKYELIIIDDGSTDGTKKLINELQQQYPQLRIVSHQTKLGYGAALKTGITCCRYDWIFFTDADLQFDLNELHVLMPYTKTFDVIIGWRKNRAEGVRRSLNARLFKIYIDILFRVGVKDIDCAFKLFRASVIKNIQLESSSAFTTSELLYKLKKRGIPIKELPVSHFPRTAGSPTGANVAVIIKACYEALRHYGKIKYHSTIAVFSRQN